jgi:outer membrane protein
VERFREDAMSRVLALLALIGAAIAQAQYPGAALRLRDCIRMALERHPDMALARAQLSAAAADLTAAFGSYLPSITFSAGYSRQLNVEGGRTINVGGQIIRLPAVDPNSYSMSLIGTYTLFDGFAREGVFQQRRAAVDAAEAGLEFTRQQLVAQVVQHYIEALKAERIVAVRQRFYELAQQELERARAQVELGRMAPTLLPTQESELANREVALLQARQERDLARLRLALLIGADPGQELRLADPEIADSIPEAELVALRQQLSSPELLVQKALAQRTDLAAAQRRLRAAEALLNVARGSSLPTITASGGWSWANSALRDFSQLGRSFIGVQLSLPIFDNFRTHSQLENARLQQVQAAAQVERLRQQIITEVRTTALKLEALAAQLLAAQRAVRAAETAFAAARERAQLGMLTPIERLTAEAQLLSAHTTAVQLAYEFQATRMQLRFALGELQDVGQ